MATAVRTFPEALSFGEAPSSAAPRKVGSVTPLVEREPIDTYIPGRYSAAARSRWPVMASVIVAHVAVVAVAMMTIVEVGEARRNERLAVFEVNDPLPPPPVEAAPPPPEQQLVLDVPATPQIVVPKAIVQTMQPSPIPVAVADVAPVKVAAVVAAPAAPVAAPPAPIVPPDFSASQLGNPGPTYPYLSRKAREEGVVTLRVLVGSNGRAETLQVETSSGFDRLDKAALATVRKWRFLPATQAGAKIAAWVLVPVTFRLA